MKKIRILLLTTAVSLFIETTAQIKNYSPVNYGPKQYGTHYDPNNNAIAQDSRGIMYFGTTNAVWQFDGQNWQRIEIKAGISVSSILVSQTCDTIFVGAQNEFGFLVSNGTGYEYISLYESVKDIVFPFSDIWKIFNISGKIYFQCYDYIFMYDGVNVHIYEPETVFHNSFCVHNQLFVRQREIGLCQLDSTQFKLIPGGEIFANIGIFGIEKIDDNKYLIISYEDGSWIMDGTTITRYSQAFNKALKSSGFNVTSCVMLNDTTLALGSYDNGIMVITTKGRIITHKTTDNGLNDNLINKLFCDRERNLWFTTSKGITLLPNNDYTSYFSAESGIEGGVFAITEYKGKLYLGTTNGLLVQNKNLKTYSEPLYLPVEAMSRKVSSLNVCLGWLLVGTDDGVYQMTNDGKFEKIFPLKDMQCEVSCLSFNAETKTLLVGYNNGVAVLKNESGAWKYEETLAEYFDIKKIETEINSDGLLVAWLGTTNHGLIRITFNGADTKQQLFSYGENNGLERGLSFPTKIDGKICFVNQGALLKFTQDIIENQEFEGFQNYEENPWCFDIFLISSLDSISWISNGTNIAYHFRGEENLHNTQFRGLNAGRVNTIYTTDNKIVWLGTTEGLVMCVNEPYKHQEFPGLIRGIKLKINNQEINLESENLKFPYKNNSLSISYSASWYSISDSVKFKYYLTSMSYEDSSEWTRQSTIDFNHLHEGTYTFTVKARNAFGDKSTEAVCSFRISPPWYRTIVAYIAYVLLLVAAVFGIIKYYTYQLKERNRLLDLEVKRQTKQIEKQLVKIEEQNHSLTDSINYAARIQQMSLPNTSFVNNYVSESFILFMPRDIVSGDFYWCAEADNKLIITAADCTGHGVPGAMMSMLGMNALNTIVKVRGTTDPGAILNDLRASVVRSFADKGPNAAKDGMDICMLTIDNETNKLMFAGAYNSLIQIRNGELTEFKVDKFPCALSDQYEKGIMFTTQTIDMQKGDCYYFFSDGYCDQFGGEDGQKKFMKARFKRHLLELWQQPMEKQGEELHRIHLEFKGDTEQIDDILVIGIRI